MEMNKDPKWLEDKANAEDGCYVSVGGLVTDLERANDEHTRAEERNMESEMEREREK